MSAQRLSAAVAKREYGSFVRTLASRPGASNPVVTAAFHLRHSGVRHTAVLAGRYLRNHVQGSQVTRAVAGSRGSAASLRTQDVMFGLMVIQQRLGGIDSRLGEMEARLVAIEARIADLGGATRTAVRRRRRGTAPQRDAWTASRIPSAAASASAIVTSMSR